MEDNKLLIKKEMKILKTLVDQVYDYIVDIKSLYNDLELPNIAITANNKILEIYHILDKKDISLSDSTLFNLVQIEVLDLLKNGILSLESIKQYILILDTPNGVIHYKYLITKILELSKYCKKKQNEIFNYEISMDLLNRKDEIDDDELFIKLKNELKLLGIENNIKELKTN